ncbi:dUTP diphosphatase [Bacillus sp. FSL R10-2789]|uniref:dUTP diphosphatase n=1 Tax=Bacillus sp. FSL R10-2789 TaxID=2954662 RepID=UPI0030F94D5F
MSLQFLLDSQKTFQERMGNNFEVMTLKERSDYMKEHGYFLMEEVMEMFREMPFHKSWKDYSGLTPKEVEEQDQLMREEAIDALHFMINIFLALDMNEAEIIGMYKEKNKLNYQRQEDSNLGYVNK